jgi:hypothetical protein
MATAALPASVSKGLVALAALDSAAFSAVRTPFTWRDVVSHLLDACSAQTRFFLCCSLFSLRSSLCTVADHPLVPSTCLVACFFKCGVMRVDGHVLTWLKSVWCTGWRAM